MKIIHLASGDLWAGAEVQLFHLAIHIARQEGVDLLVVLLNEGELACRLRENDVAVEVISEVKYNFFHILKLFHRIVTQFKPQIIHTHRSKENIIGGIVGWLTNCSGVRTVHGAQETHSRKFNLRNRTLGYINRLVGRFFQNKVIAVSAELGESLTSEFGQKKIEVIENSIDIEHVQYLSEAKPEYSISKENLNIAYVGRFVPVKRVDIFYDIAKKILEKRPEGDVNFYMLGDGPLLLEIQKRAELDALTKHIHLLGFVKNVPALLKNIDLLVITSDHEGLPITLLEAMALNVPVMSRNLPTVKSVLCDGKCGSIVDTDTFPMLAAEIEEFLTTQDVYKGKAIKAYNRLNDSYSLVKNLNRYIELYRTILK